MSPGHNITRTDFPTTPKYLAVNIIRRLKEFHYCRQIKMTISYVAMFVQRSMAGHIGSLENLLLYMG